MGLYYVNKGLLLDESQLAVSEEAGLSELADALPTAMEMEIGTWEFPELEILGFVSERLGTGNSFEMYARPEMIFEGATWTETLCTLLETSLGLDPSEALRWLHGETAGPLRDIKRRICELVMAGKYTSAEPLIHAIAHCKPMGLPGFRPMYEFTSGGLFELHDARNTAHKGQRRILVEIAFVYD